MAENVERRGRLRPRYTAPSVGQERELPPAELLNHPEILELPEYKELWYPLFDSFTISGHPGTGKTVAGLALAYLYGTRFYKAGGELREWAQREQGKKVVDYVDRPAQVDLDLDAKQAELIRRANEDGPIIVEGRLAGIIATELILGALQAGEVPPNVIRGLWVANRTVRSRRIARREEEINVVKKTRSRERQDLETWRNLRNPDGSLAHPLLQDPKITDIYNPYLRNEAGDSAFFDILVNTTHYTLDEVIRRVHRYFVRHGYVIKLDRPEEPSQIESARKNSVTIYQGVGK